MKTKSNLKLNLSQLKVLTSSREVTGGVACNCTAGGDVCASTGGGH